MNKLLTASFARIKKDKFFWIGMAGMLVFGAFLAFMQYQEHVQHGCAVRLDNVFAGHALVIGILCAVFSSLFIGTEYSDGTIRNKLIVGHTRIAVYFSNLIINIVAALLMCLAFAASVSAVGIPLIGFLEADVKTILLTVLGCVIMTVAFCSLCTMVCMVNQNKTISAIITIVGVFALMLAASMILSKLTEPEFYNSFSMPNASGASDSIIYDSTSDASAGITPNPGYLRGSERSFYEFLLDFLPSGQAMQYSSMTAVHLWQMPLYSLIIIFLSTGIGAVAFRRKDVK